jgi:dolichyl-diphosphooligosaccharide--protein glycosyltransferase
MFLLTWRGAFLLALTILVYFIIQFIVDHLKQKSTDYLCIIGITTFLVALLMFLPASRSPVYLVPLVFASLVPLVLSIVSRLMAGKRIRPAYYPLILCGLCLVSLAILYVVQPSVVKSMTEQLSMFMPSESNLTTAEMRPILFPSGHFSLTAVWGNFTTGFFLSLISLVVLIYFTFKRIEADKLVLIVWSLMMLAATLLLRRFAVLFAINVSLLTGYILGLILEYAGLRESPLKPVETTEKEEKEEIEPKRTHGGGFHITTDQIAIALAVILAFFIIFFNISPAITIAKAAPFTLTDNWYQALSWMKHNTPDPFGDPDFYYERNELPYHYPETAYGVVAWWDYGYHIIRISHRLPVCDPGGGPREAVASLFTAQDEASANQITNELISKYIIIDYAAVTTVFDGILTYAGSDSEEFYDTYYQLVAGKLRPTTLYSPQYYRSLSTRLYNFNGKEVNPKSIPVISYEEKMGSDGKIYKEITDQESFASYEEAMSYITSQETGKHMIGGTDRFNSPIPLEALETYKLVYSSDRSMGRQVKIFEYVP